jgi:small subunit ribosomal protein S1
VTKVVTFGAFVEILPGVEGLVHISELAQHHVENPREVVAQGDTVKVLVLEIDAERRRLSLSLKRVEGGGVQERPNEEPIEGDSDLQLSEEAFPASASAPDEAVEVEDSAVEDGAVEDGAVEDGAVEETAVEDAPVATDAAEDTPATEPVAEAEAEPADADAAPETAQPEPADK